MSQSVEDQVREIIANVFNCPLASVGADASSETIDGWDSLHHLNLVLAVEERFALSIDPWAAAELVSVPAIVQAIAEQRGG